MEEQLVILSSGQLKFLIHQYRVYDSYNCFMTCGIAIDIPKSIICVASLDPKLFQLSMYTMLIIVRYMITVDDYLIAF